MFSKKKKILKINEISNKEVNIAGKEVKEYLMNIFKELEYFLDTRNNKLVIVNGANDSFKYIIRRFVLEIDSDFEISKNELYSKKEDVRVYEAYTEHNLKSKKKIILVKENVRYTPKTQIMEYREVLNGNYSEIQLIKDITEVLNEIREINEDRKCKCIWNSTNYSN